MMTVSPGLLSVKHHALERERAGVARATEALVSTKSETETGLAMDEFY